MVHLHYIQLEFAEGKGIPVDYVSLVPASVGEGKIYTQSPIAGDYCEPNFEDFKKKMRMVYENYEFYKEKSKPYTLLQHFTKLYNALHNTLHNSTTLYKTLHKFTKLYTT